MDWSRHPILAVTLAFGTVALLASASPVRAQLPTGPTTPILDDFDRPDENPLSGGGNWKRVYPSAGLRLVSQQAANQGGNGWESSYWTTVFPLPQEAFVTLGAMPTTLDRGLSLGLRMDDVNPVGTPNGYNAQWRWQGGTAAIVQIFRIDDEVGHSLGQATASMKTGDRFAFRAEGSTLSAFLDTGQGFQLVLQVSDSRYDEGGYISLGIRGAATRADGFGGGEIIVPPPPEQSTGTCGGKGVHAVSGSDCLKDPVNTLTGSFTTSVADLRLPGIGVPFAWNRTYTSSDPTSGRLGPGWTDSFAVSLAVQGGGDVILRGEEGQQVYYTRQPSGSFLGAAGARSLLSEVASGYELLRRDQVLYRFDAQGRLLSIRDRNGQGLTLAYDGSGQLQTITDSVGRQIVLQHTGGLLSRVTLPDGRYVEYGYTAGRLSSVRDARGETTTYAYDAAGRLQRIVDQNGHQVVRNVYDAGSGRLLEQYDPLEERSTFAWDPATQTATMTDARGNAWRDVYAGNVLVRRIDPLGNTWRYQYDADLNVKRVTDARGHATVMTYGVLGRLLTRTAPAPLAYQEVWTYNTRNDPLTYRDARGSTTDFGYDAAGNLTSLTGSDPDGAGPLTRPVTLFGRDPAGSGLLTSLTDPRGKQTSFSYTAGNLSEIRTQLGHRTTLCYDGSGRLIGLVDPRGTQSCETPNEYRWSYAYDAHDQLETQTDPLGHVTTLAYDPAGNLESRTDANGHETAYGYDDANRLQTVTAPDPDGTGPLLAPGTTYGYDEVGNLQTRTDANAHLTSYDYDDANRLERVTAPDTRVWTYAYDPNGNVEEVVDANGNSTPAQGDGKTSYGYDVLNRLISVDYSDSTPDVAFAYDGNDNRTQMTDGSGTESYAYDTLDRLTSVTRAGQTLSFGYDLLTLTSRTYPGMPVTSYAYDDDERLQAVSWGSNVVSYLYDPAANLTRTTLPAGNGWRENRAYDRSGRLTSIVTQSGPQGAEAVDVLSSFSLTLDPVGNPLERIRSGTLEGTESYAYDDLDRLTSVCFQSGTCPGASDPFVRWSYDGVGNRLSETRPSGQTSYAYNAADELLQAGTTSYTYDRNGNQLSAGARTFAWDLANRLKSTTLAGTTTTYAYDGEGKRLQASTGSQASQKTNFLWDPSFPLAQLVAEADGAGAALRRYRHGHRPLHVTAGSSVSYFHYDPLGSIVDVTAASGGGGLRWSYGFEPFGLTRTEQQYGTGQPVNLLKFTGEYLDPSGLYHLRARQYDPGSARFLSRDPVAASRGAPYVSSYAYVINRPTVLIDPTGLVFCEGTRFVFGKFLGSEPPGSICALEVAGKAVKPAFRPIEVAVELARDNPDETLALATVGACLTGVGCTGATLASLGLASYRAGTAFSKGCRAEGFAIGLESAVPWGVGRGGTAILARQRRVLFGPEFSDDGLTNALHRLFGVGEGLVHLGPSLGSHCGK